MYALLTVPLTTSSTAPYMPYLLLHPLLQSTFHPVLHIVLHIVLHPVPYPLLQQENKYTQAKEKHYLYVTSSTKDIRSIRKVVC